MIEGESRPESRPAEGNSPEVETLREEVRKLREEIKDARVERAARHLELMRNWMTAYTPIVTMMFLLFAYLGYRGQADIQANREKFEATSGQAAKLLSDVTSRFDIMKKEQDGFEKLVKDNQQVVQQNKAVLQGFRSSVDELERKHSDLRRTEDEITHSLGEVSTQVKNTANSLSGSLSLSRGIGGIVSNSLNVPVITSLSSSAAKTSTLNGFGLGSPGRVFLKLGANGLFNNVFDLEGELSSGGAVEVARDAILSWTENTITFQASEVEKVTGGKGGLLVQVMTSSGTKSNVYAVPTQPAAPSGLTVTPQ